MKSVQQIISSEFENELRKQFSSQQIMKATLKVADEAINIMRERCNSGYDVNGKRFAPYTPKYRKYKQNYIKSGEKVNEFAAKKLPNHIRLSGALFGKMKTQIIQAAQFSSNKINTTFRLYIDPSQAKKVEGLLSDKGVVRTKKGKKTYSKASRQFFGIATTGTRAKSEKLRLTMTFIKSLGSTVSLNNFKVK